MYSYLNLSVWVFGFGEHVCLCVWNVFIVRWIHIFSDNKLEMYDNTVILIHLHVVNETQDTDTGHIRNTSHALYKCFRPTPHAV